MIKIVPILLILPLLCFSEMPGGEKDTAKYFFGGSLSKKREAKKPLAKAIFPEITFEIQAVTGPYSREQIKAVADSNLLSLRTIYYKYLNKGLDFDGNVLLKFTIAKNGEITKVDMVHSSTGNVEFDKAIKSKVASWKWKPIETGNTTVKILFKLATFFHTYPSGYPERNSYIINGARPIKDILSKIISMIPLMTATQNKHFRLKPDLNDVVVVIFKFEIAGSGEVTNVDILVDTAEYPEFEEAIKSIVANWKWKPIETGNTTVSVLWIFDKL